MVPDERPLHFRTRHRLTHARQFQAVYLAQVRKIRGPLIVFTLPNTLPHHRLGLAVGTRVGNAVIRNQVKRRLREAFRLEQFNLPAPGPEKHLDIVISVRPGRVLPLSAYRTILFDLVTQASNHWRR